MPLVERPPKGKGLGDRLAYVRVLPGRGPRVPRESSARMAREKATTRESSLVALFHATVASTLVPPRRERRAYTKPSFRKTKKPIFFFFTPSPSPVVPDLSPRFVTPNAHEQVKAVGMALWARTTWCGRRARASSPAANARPARQDGAEALAVGAGSPRASRPPSPPGSGDTSAGRDVRCETRQRRHRLGHRHRRSSFGRRREGPRAHGRVATSAAQAFLALALWKSASRQAPRRGVGNGGVRVELRLAPPLKSKTA